MNHLQGLEIPTSSFPLLLMDILDKRDTSDIASWLPNGRAFIIHNKKRFASEILPVYFKQAKYSSYARRMKRWGFTLLIPCKQSGSCDDTYGSKSVYHHPLFLRSSKSLCLQMRPQPQKKYVKKHNHATRKASTASDPNSSAIFQSRNSYSLCPRTNGSATYPYSSGLTIEAGISPTIESSIERRLKENWFQQDLLLQERYHQQEISAHHQYLQDSPGYKQLYESHMLRLSVQHRNELEIIAKFSALAYENLMLKAIRGNEMGNPMGLLPY